VNKENVDILRNWSNNDDDEEEKKKKCVMEGSSECGSKRDTIEHPPRIREFNVFLIVHKLIL